MDIHLYHVCGDRLVGEWFVLNWEVDGLKPFGGVYLHLLYLGYEIWSYSAPNINSSRLPNTIDIFNFIKLYLRYK